MLSTLPPELLREIIEATVPHSFHSSTYRTRQNTLCALSLVSKRFRAIAQPLLLEIVWLQSPQDANLLHALLGGEGGEQERVTFVKQAILSYGWSGPSPEERSNLRDMLSGVTALSMYLVHKTALSFTDLECLHRLTSLTLSYISCQVPRTSTLQHLESLTLYTGDTAFVSSFLDLVALPNLRNFAFFDFPVPVPQQSAFARLIPELETLCTVHGTWEHPASAFLYAYVDKALIISHVDSLSMFWPPRQDIPFAHLLVCGANILKEEHASDTSYSLDAFASCIETNPPSSLKTIYLDPDLRDVDSLPLEVRHSAENLARVCRQKKIEVVFEPVPRNFTIDPWILPDFVRRQKQRRSQEKGN